MEFFTLKVIDLFNHMAEGLGENEKIVLDRIANRITNRGFKKRLGHKTRGNLGKHHSDETKAKLSESRLGEKNPNYGKKMSLETRKKMSESHLGKAKSEEAIAKTSGANHYMWREGASFLPYSPEFNKSLKRKIKKRDNHICRVCGRSGNSIHHIDYDKANNTESNLVTLCVSCNSKANFNIKYWIDHFRGLIG